MKLRGIKFEKVHCASGARGFYGEGYRYHEPLKKIGLDFEGSTLVAKTTTYPAREGFMALQKDFTPRDLYPDCIRVYPAKGLVLNAVGLSGPGAEELFRTGWWQMQTKPFFLSFMSVAKTREERLHELRQFVDLLKLKLPAFRAPVGLQINYSCPNTGHELEELLKEIWEGLTIAAELGIPLMPKINVEAPVEAVREFSRHPACDAICISNTIPYGNLPDRIPWEKLFGSAKKEKSPLAKYGGGGLSGKLLLPLLIEWVNAARKCGITKPLNMGGGILSVFDAMSVLEVSGSSNDSIFLGSIALLRPWRVKDIIASVNGDWKV